MRTRLPTCLPRWKRSRKEPSLEKTLTGFGLEGALAVEGRDVEEEAVECAVDMADEEELQESREMTLLNVDQHVTAAPSCMDICFGAVVRTRTIQRSIRTRL